MTRPLPLILALCAAALWLLPPRRLCYVEAFGLIWVGHLEDGWLSLVWAPQQLPPGVPSAVAERLPVPVAWGLLGLAVALLAWGWRGERGGVRGFEVRAG